MSNNFDTNVLLDAGVGTPAAPGDYIGFGRAANGVVSTGPRIYAGNGDPSNVLNAPRGSIYLRADVGMVYINTDNITTWVQAGTLAGAVALTGIDSTATNNFDWDLADNQATAFTFDAPTTAGLFGVDTTIADPNVWVGQEFRVRDAAALTFGTPGTDVVLTSDGANVDVTGTGLLNWLDDVQIGFGTGAAGVPDVTMEFDTALAPDAFLLQSVNVAGGLNAFSAGYEFRSGTLTVNAAALGLTSGGFNFVTGASDVTDAGGSSGGSGGFAFTTGNAASTAGAASGPSGGFAVVTGNSADGASGDIVFTTGTAGTNRGVIDINAPTIDLATQATDFDIIDNTDAALTITQGANVYLYITTQNGTERMDFGCRAISPDIQFDTNGFIQTDGIDHGTRLVLSEQFDQRPAIAADIANTNASKKWEVAGTNAATAGATFDTGGGILLTTAGALNDQEIIWPNTTGADNSQSPFMGTQWSTSERLIFKANVKVIDTANIRFATGWKITTTLDTGTDADQCYIAFDSAGGLGGTAGEWVLVTSVGGADTQVDLNVVASAGVHRIVLYQAADRTVQAWVDGVLLGTSAALGAGVLTLKPFAGIQALNASARTGTISRITCSKTAS